MASLLTFFSGFGIGTVLMPILAIYFHLPLAIVITAYIHLFANLIKVIGLYRYIDKRIFLYFCFPAVTFAYLGAYTLGRVQHKPPLFEYSLMGNQYTIMPLNFIAGFLLLLLVLDRLVSFLKTLLKSSTTLSYFISGGLSGFFGGLTGYQGAFRSAVLVHAVKDSRVFVSTTSSIALVIDVVRVYVYSSTIIISHYYMDHISNILAAFVASIFGIAFGLYIVKWISINSIRYFVRLLLTVLAVLILFGFIS